MIRAIPLSWGGLRTLQSCERAVLERRNSFVEEFSWRFSGLDKNHQLGKLIDKDDSGRESKRSFN
jgi:hypothetical protein